MLKPLVKITILLSVLYLLVSCCSLQPEMENCDSSPVISGGPQEFEPSIKGLIDRLEYGIRKEDNSLSIQMKIAPFVYLRSPKSCPFATLLHKKGKYDIENSLIDGSKYPFFTIKKDVTQPRYIMYAVIEKEIYDFDNNTNLPKKAYKITVRIIDNNSKINPFLTDDYTLIKDSGVTIKEIPTILNKSEMENKYRELFPEKICGFVAPVSERASRDFEINKNDAKKAFDDKKFDKALEYYKKAVKIFDNNLSLLDDKISPELIKDELYSGIIESIYRLPSNLNEDKFIAKIYQKWLENHLVDMGEKIQWIFLFKENSTEFADDVEIKEETKIYPQRLQMIDNYFKESGFCLKVVGYNKPDLEIEQVQEESHSSDVSGDLDMPKSLGRQRIDKIYGNLKNVPNKTFDEKIAVTEDSNNGYPEHRKVKVSVEKCSEDSL